MKNDIVKAIENITARTGNTWASLEEIYKEVEAIRGVPNANGGATIRRTIGDHCANSEHFRSQALFVSLGVGSGMYSLTELDPKNITTPKVFTPSLVAPITLQGGPLNIRKKPDPDSSRNYRGNLQKPDYQKLEQTRCENGEENESLIYEWEYNKVKEFASQAELDRMATFFTNRNDSEGYDILSFSWTNGIIRPIYIEVKSTISSESTTIDITANELFFAKAHVDDYYLYRVYQEGDRRFFKIVSGKELLNNYLFEPTTYRIYMK